MDGPVTMGALRRVTHPLLLGLAFGVGLGINSVRAHSAPGVTERAFAVSDLLGRSANEVRGRIGARTPDHDYVTEVRLTNEGEVVVRDADDMSRGGGLCAAKSRLWFKQADFHVFPRFHFRRGRLQEMRDLDGKSFIPADRLLTVQCVPVVETYADKDVAAWVVFGPWAAAAAVAHTPETIARARARAALTKLRLGKPPPRGLAAYAAYPPARVQVQLQAPGRALITVDLGRDNVTKDRDLVRAEVADGRIVAVFKARLNFVPCWIERDQALHCGATAAPL